MKPPAVPWWPRCTPCTGGGSNAPACTCTTQAVQHNSGTALHAGSAISQCAQHAQQGVQQAASALAHDMAASAGSQAHEKAAHAQAYLDKVDTNRPPAPPSCRPGPPGSRCCTQPAAPPTPALIGCGRRSCKLGWVQAKSRSCCTRPAGHRRKFGLSQSATCVPVDPGEEAAWVRNDTDLWRRLPSA